MIEIVKQFVNDFSVTDYVGAIVGIVFSIATFYNFVSNRLKEEKNEIIEKHLITNESIDEYVKNLNKNITHHPSLYKTLLSDRLGYITSILGNLKVFSVKSFVKHYIFSFMYSLIFFYMAWLLGATGQIGSLRFIENIDNRNVITLMTIFQLIITYFIIKNFKKIKKYFSLKENTIEMLIFLFLVFNFIIFSLIFGIYFGLVIFFSIGILSAMMSHEEYLSTFPIFIIVIRIVSTVVMFFASWYISTILIAAILKKDLLFSSESFFITEINIMVFLFGLVLPFINSIFDYISMFFSRFFAQKILETNSKIKIIIDVFLDLLIAIILLYLLAQTLVYIIGLVNIYLIKDISMFIPIDKYKIQILNNPFNKDVLWITLMFTSTLIPTILHLFLAVYALLAYLLTKPHLHELVVQLNDLKPNDPNYLKKENIAKGLVSYRLSGMIKIYIFIGTILLLFFATSVLMLLLKKGLYVL